MTYDPTTRVQRQREKRRAERQRERHAANMHLRAVVRAIGGGEPEDWQQDAPKADCPSGVEITGGGE